MDLKIGEDGRVETAVQDRGLGSKVKGVGSISSKDMFLRADMIDLKNLDYQPEKHLSRVWSGDKQAPKPKEEWEIDLSKLDIRYVVAHGTYGTVYRGVYDGQDVAVKILDWGEDDVATTAEIAALRATFLQEVAVWHKLDHPNVTKNLRPEIPRCCLSSLANIMRKCWDANAEKRPEMNEVVRLLEAIDTREEA